VQEVALGVTDDAHDWPGQHFRDRIDGVHDPELEGVEHDERAHGVDPREVDEGLDDDRIHPAPRVVPHLLQHLRGGKRRRLIRPARRRGVEAVGHRHDLAEHAHRPRTERTRIAREVQLHVMLVRHDHGAVRQVLLAA
jgi:hypothetical protein